MKKKVLFVASLFLATATFAQDGLTSKKGEAYLPEAGDWAIGFDGTPFLDYVGNMFNGTSGNTVTAGWQPINVGDVNTTNPFNVGPMYTLSGKYFKDEKTAYRIKVRIGFGSTTANNVFDTTTTTVTGELTDEFKQSHFAFTIGGGIEKRKGNTRIQGFYGGELLFSMGSMGTEYTYADKSFGQTAVSGVTDATYTDWASWSPTNTGNAATVTNSNERELKRSMGSTMILSLRGFVGVEWFLAPKVSVSAEYGWGLAFIKQGDGEQDTEEYMTPTGGAAGTESYVARKHVTGGTSGFGIDTDNNGGAISIHFHF
jgi:hypothetical protein